MALNIKHAEVEQLATEMAVFCHTTKTEAIRVALVEHRERTVRQTSGEGREARLRHFLKSRVWPTIPATARRPWTKNEEDEALGYGPAGEAM